MACLCKSASHVQFHSFSNSSQTYSQLLVKSTFGDAAYYLTFYIKDLPKKLPIFAKNLFT